MKQFNNQQLEEAFQRLNMYCFASENDVVKNVLYNGLESISKECIRRDNTLYFKLTQHLNAVKGFIQNVGKPTRTDQSDN